MDFRHISAKFNPRNLNLVH